MACIIIAALYLGRRNPVQPATVQAVNITSTSATVQWVVPYLSYTPEQYIVLYGTAEAMLDQTSTTLDSTTDITSLNVTYQVVIEGLVPNTLYHFQLRSTNTIGETTAAVMTFMTSEAGTLYITQCHQILYY